MRALVILPLCAGTVVLLALAGCSSNKTPTLVGEHGHQHIHGPHDGELIEIGEGQYYAEMIHDDQAGTVTIYILDKSHEKPIPIEAGAITIKMVANATPVEFKLAAKPQEGDPEGKSSQFESREQALGLALDNEQAERELIIPIGGKPYQAKFAHFEDEHHHHHEPPPTGGGEQAK
jgi:hypothetical protein